MAAIGTWEKLKVAADNGTLNTIVRSGDIIPVTLGNHERLKFAVTRDESGKTYFVLTNKMRTERQMNNEPTAEGGWAACDMRRYLNEEVFALLPDELQSVVAPTKIVQIMRDKRIESTDKLFLLSSTQVFGKFIYSEQEPEDSQLDWFSNRQRRKLTKTVTDPIWWWLRTLGPTGHLLDIRYNYFHIVDNNGDPYVTNPALHNGVVFAFCLN